MATSTSGTISGGSGPGDLGFTVPKYEAHMHISRWLEKLELYATLKGFDDDRKLALVKFLLPDHVIHAIEATSPTSFDDVKSTLLAFEVKKSPEEEAFNNLKSARKGSMSWNEFGQKVRTWAFIAYGPTAADREAKDVIFCQLSPEEQRNIGIMEDSWNSKELLRELI